MKAVEKNICQANDLFIQSVRDGKKEIQEAVKAEKKAVFKTWANCGVFIFLGCVICVLGILAWNFFKVQDGFYTELAESKKLEQIQKDAVKEYKAELLKDPKHKEITWLVDEWNRKNAQK